MRILNLHSENKITAPYGTWKSDITVETATSKTVVLKGVQVCVSVYIWQIKALYSYSIRRPYFDIKTFFNMAFHTNDYQRSKLGEFTSPKKV